MIDDLAAYAVTQFLSAMMDGVIDISLDVPVEEQLMATLVKVPSHIEVIKATVADVFGVDRVVTTQVTFKHHIYK